MNKKIYAIYTCNIWKETDSMRLLCVSTSFEKIKAIVKKNIKQGNMCFDKELELKEQVAEFKDFDWTIEKNTEINDRLEYGFFDFYYDGEEI